VTGGRHGSDAVLSQDCACGHCHDHEIRLAGVTVMLEIMGEQDDLAFMKKLAAKDLYMP
jgi:hypothetical protein